LQIGEWKTTMVTASKNTSAPINRTGSVTILILGMLLIGCTHNIAVQSMPNFSNTHTDKIKTKTLLIISEDLSNYVYKGTGSTPEFPGFPLLDTWVFPLGQPTSELLREGAPHIFNDIEVAAETPLGNDPKGTTYGLILKPSIESFDFGIGPSIWGNNWVKIKYKIEVLDLNGRVVFHKTVTGRGESNVEPFGGSTNLGKAADYALQNGVNLLLDSLYESKEVRELQE
jgi:hypothetical protein